MSMMIVEDGTAYSSSYYILRNQRVYNPETNRSLGILVRTIPSTNYLCLKQDTLWLSFKRLFRSSHRRTFKDDSIKSTMEGLER